MQHTTRPRRSTRALRLLALAAPLAALAPLAQAQISSSNRTLTGTNVSALTGTPSTTVGGVTFTNHGLVGVGRIEASSLDNWGESLGSVSGLQVTGWTNNGSNNYSGRFNILPDRGYNAGTTYSNYAARIQAVDFTFTPYTGTATSGVAQNQFNLTYNAAASTKFTYNNGTSLVTTTGLIPDSSTTFAGSSVPYVTVSNGTPTFPTSGGTTINRVAVDAEALVLLPDGSGWVSDEYGANVYRFNSAKEITGVLGQPAAITPRTAGGVLAFSSEVTPATGRRGNQGMEGLALSPDGQKLYGLMQSATVQDSGTGNQGRFNTRLLVWDVSTDNTPSAISGEYVIQLPIGNDSGTGSPNRNFAQSEIIALDSNHLLVLSRDGNGKGVSNTNAPVYKSVLLVDLSLATNIAGTAFDNQTGDITPGAATSTTLDAGITPISWAEAVNLLNTFQLGKYDLNLNGGSTANENTLSEKWEGLSLVPTGNADEYFLFVANDNDFISGATKMVGLDGTTINNYDVLTTNGLPVENDTMFLAYRVSITGLSAIPEPASYTALLGLAGLALAATRRRRRR
jgi:MYXO-CTERM domain-containing protein